MALRPRFMSKFIPWRRTPPSTEEELDTLTQEIKKLTDEILNKQQLERVVVRKLLIFSSIGYGALAIFVYFYMLAHHDDESGSVPSVKSKSSKVKPNAHSNSEPRAVWLAKLAVILVSPPFFIFCIIRLLQWAFRWQVARGQARVRECLQRKQRLLDNVRDTEPYNKAVQILSKYGEKGSYLPTPGKAATLLSEPPGGGSSNKSSKAAVNYPAKPEGKDSSFSLRQRPNTTAAKSRSLAEPNSSSGGNEPEASSSLYAANDNRKSTNRQPPPQTRSHLLLPSQPEPNQAEVPKSPSLSSYFSRALSSTNSAAGLPAAATPPPPASTQQSQRPAPLTRPNPDPISAVTNARPPPASRHPVVQRQQQNLQSPQKPTLLDRAVSWLVGEGTEYRFALICRHCFRHNGLALPEEFEYIGFKCCYCDEVNYPRKQRPAPPPEYPVNSLKPLSRTPANWTPQPQMPAPSDGNRLSSGRYSMPTTNVHNFPTAAVQDRSSSVDLHQNAEVKLAPIASVAECDEEMFREEVTVPTSEVRRASAATSSGTVSENENAQRKESRAADSTAELHTVDSQSGIIQPAGEGSAEKTNAVNVTLDDARISTFAVNSIDMLSDEESEASG